MSCKEASNEKCSENKVWLELKNIISDQKIKNLTKSHKSNEISSENILHLTFKNNKNDLKK